MEVFEFIFGQYRDYSSSHIVLELVAIAASIISVYFSFKNSVLVFPFGIMSTLIFVYLLFQWNLLGDMVINAYYFIMSIYGWYYWLHGGIHEEHKPITIVLKKEWISSFAVFSSTAIAIYLLYFFTERLESWISYVDMITTGIFFVGMWLMARRKLEHWLVLGLGNLISIPLYFYKGYSFSAILYILLLIFAIFGFLQWKKYLNRKPLTV
ncbi:nicotinamide mononucleotide transporter [Nonlabens dokdonensis]|uniref:Nicotinamide riboside transporter PnuC n=2 Tax=Nonlabens dokdonensis TaxID=328515 RepID=L7W9X7_NONDD|nr:nicotinamide riboside transporter PnuC [Nonlabens dokdonensis]AGC76646.1 nicotinamide mononucleotide transporter [Nonlabens dokdonensis DSW-6]PZX44295.1 nicotinamide mononucleotide transporter [Nonlabens dokdonensis]